MRKALQCITLGRFVLFGRTQGIEVGTPYSAALNEMSSVRLKSRDGIYFVAGQTVEIYEWKKDRAQQRYRVKTLAYTYGFTRKVAGEEEETELLYFHWVREQTSQNPYPLGHLHIGPGLLASPTPIRPGDFHNAHIPTERVSIESVIRFAIVELNVEPLRDDWEVVLKATENAFKTHKTA